jgi:hypothetical protein
MRHWILVAVVVVGVLQARIVPAETASHGQRPFRCPGEDCPTGKKDDDGELRSKGKNPDSTDGPPASKCVTDNGSCALTAPHAIGKSCYCTGDDGLVPGLAR